MMDGNTCIHKFTTYLRHETGVNLTTVKIPVGKRFITWEGSPGADKTCAQVCSPNLAVWPTRRPAWWMSHGPPCWIYVHTDEYIWKGQSIYYAFSHLYLQIVEMISILLTLEWRQEKYTQRSQCQQHNLRFIGCRVAMAEWLARRTPNHKIVGSSPAKSQVLIYGWVNQGTIVATRSPHGAVLMSRLAFGGTRTHDLVVGSPTR